MTDAQHSSSLTSTEALSLSRRSLVKKSGSTLLGATLLSTIGNLSSRQAMAAQIEPVTGPFGQPVETLDLSTGLPLLKLPRGFRYASYSWTGDMMDDGHLAPARHDGMAIVASRGRELTLVRNHEVRAGAIIQGSGVYDPVLRGNGTLGGGTTTLKFDGRTWQSAHGSLGGTVVNCSGGSTPWGSWLSCEETVSDYRDEGGKLHGFVFEVPASGPSTGNPLEALGLFRHEAVAIDPLSNIAYLTEDNSDRSGLYRFLPTDNRGGVESYMAGGQLQMLAISDEPNAYLRYPIVGDKRAVKWVDIENPTMLPADFGRSGPFQQAYEKGGATFRRLEGACYYDHAIYFTDTSSGPADEGTVWVYRINPDERSGDGELEAIFVAETTATGNNPDNLTISPQGLVLFCEDGGSQSLRMMGLTPQGESFVFGVNNTILDNSDIATMGRTGQFGPNDYTRQEWAGACFSPRGDVLFVNIQTPGITFAIWGPFGRARR